MNLRVISTPMDLLLVSIESHRQGVTGFRGVDSAEQGVHVTLCAAVHPDMPMALKESEYLFLEVWVFCEARQPLGDQRSHLHAALLGKIAPA